MQISCLSQAVIVDYGIQDTGISKVVIPYTSIAYITVSGFGGKYINLHLTDNTYSLDYSDGYFELLVTKLNTIKRG